MIVKRGIGKNVVDAARERIIDTFAKGQLVELSFSGGKDSLVLADIVRNLILEEKINKHQLFVTFIDEEAMYDDVIETVKKWRMKFIELGVKFDWYCLPVKHYNCLNTMTDEETFICWDPRKKDVWVRPMPQFAITDDEFLIPYKDNYQSFFSRKNLAKKIISMRGVRVSESLQRYKYIANMKTEMISLPIYDMVDKDIWLYLYKHNIDIPKTYENLYRIGTPSNKLRISQFFSIDTAKSLVSLGELYPDLMNRVSLREPNAYLCALYWDTEMFGRNTRKRKQLEENNENKDYKNLVFDAIRNEDKSEHPDVIKRIKPLIVKGSNFMDNRDYKSLYEMIQTGDPKGRKLRAVYCRVYGKEKTR